MKKIRYYYSSMSKQVFLILLMLLVAARFFIFQLVIKYDILGKASLYNVPATVAMKTASSGRCFQSAASNSTQVAASLLRCSSPSSGWESYLRQGWMSSTDSSKQRTYISKSSS